LGCDSVLIQLHERKIDATGLLQASERENPTAVAVALEMYLDRHPIRAT
jgi:hypothetical protein